VNFTVGAYVDPRQMQDLPLNGRNWIDLTMLAPGSRQNTSSDTPMGGAGNFQLNIDGQEVTNNMVQSFGQPKFSRDSIAEFEFVSNRFDASQGRSLGVHFFFQAEDGIRDYKVTGVQTCALPISSSDITRGMSELGRVSQSMAFLKAPGSELLYSGVTSRRPSAAAMRSLSAAARGGTPDRKSVV